VTGNQKILLESMSELALEDDEYFMNLIPKLQTKTGLSKIIIREALRELKHNIKVIDMIHINIIAETTGETIGDDNG
jgi:hypothetical protein